MNGIRFLSAIIIIFLFIGCNNQSDSHGEILSEHEQLVLSINDLISQSENLYHQVNYSDSIIDIHLAKAMIKCSTNELDLKLAEILNIIGKRYRNISAFGQAITYYQQNLNIGNKLNNDSLRAYSTHEIAVIFRRIDDNGQALKMHYNALEWAEATNDIFLIHSSYNGIGNIYYSYGNLPKAIEYFHHSLSYLGEPRNLLGEAINTNNIGEGWLELDRPDSALYYLNYSYDINVKIESLLGQAICKNGLGSIYVYLEDYSKAILYFKESLALNREIGDVIYVADNLRNLGNTYLKLNQHLKAEKSLIESLQIASEIGSKSQALEASKSLSTLYKKIKKPELALAFFNDAMVYKDSITKEVNEQNSKAMSILYKSEKQEREILLLKKDAELSQLKLSRQKYITTSILFVFTIAIGITLTFIRQRKLKTRFHEIELEQKLFRAQLNPHFIFNSLSAVQNFIMQNDKLAAFDYLANFSRLIRNILIGSRTEVINLENEIEILTDYLKLQQLRFQKIFEFHFNIDPNIAIEYCVVPPMLTQPFIENAIEHGIRPLLSHGVITIRFKKIDQLLQIEIEDNGIGLKNTATKENTKHTSLATTITKQRLENLQKATKSKCEIDIINKPEPEQGVLVILRIPYKESET